LITRRYILLHQSGAAPENDLSVIERHSGVRIVDRTLDRALLVDATEDVIEHLRRSLKGWAIEEEKVLPHPSSTIKGPTNRSDGEES
jgi:hypothetical protein